MSFYLQFAGKPSLVSDILVTEIKRIHTSNSEKP